jgi:probable phosphoglycerate mutase
MNGRRGEVLLVRHGETEWSRGGRHTGRTDVPLTDAGRRDAALAGERLAGRRFGRVLASPLSRAMDTCRLAGLGDVAEARDELLEWDYGAYEGLTTPEIRERRPGWWLWRDGCPDGESPDDVALRADRIVEELRDLDADAVLFAHGHVLRVLAVRWLGLAPVHGGNLALTTAALSALGYEREAPVISLWNSPPAG